MQCIGSIKQVQVQRSSLKVGERSQRYYDPSPLLVVNRLLLTRSGAIGVTAEGERMIDVHHADHPASRNREVNDISLGFTGHYEAMRDRFGPHLHDGIAGENILIEAEGHEFSLETLSGGVAIQDAYGQLIYLTEIEVAAPCQPFSQFASGEARSLTNSEMKKTLQFLHNGRRGFYAKLAPEHWGAEVRAGDKVFVLP